MAHGRIRKSNPLSASLPNVNSISDHCQSVTQVPHPLSPLLDTPFLSSPTKFNYNVDDDAWSEKTDPVTGSVFYVEPNAPSHSHLVPSSSSSSLSSNPSISDIFPASPLAESSLSNSLQLPDSPRVLENGASSPRISPFQSDKSPSLRTRLQKVMSKGKRHGKKQQHLQSGSLSNLDQLHSSFHSMSFPDLPPAPKIPQGSQFGSHGTPLPPSTSGLFTNYSQKVEIDLSQFQLGVPCSLEKLGIVPTRSLGKKKFGSLMSLQFSFKSHYPPPSNISYPVVIRAVIPGYPAASTSLKSGDTILSVNQHTVNMDNIDSVLATLSSRVHLLIKRAHSSSGSPWDHSPASSPPPCGLSSGGLVRLVMGGRGTPRPDPRKQHRHLHMLLYFTLDTEEGDPPEKDILFRYPILLEDEDGEIKESFEELMKLRGVFLTLSDVLATMTGSPSACNSSIVLKDQLIHLSCSQQGKEMLLLALPAQLVTQYQLQLLLQSVDAVVKLLFGTIHNAFTDSSHHATVQHLLDLIFDMILSETVLTPSSSLLGVPTIPRLNLPTDVVVQLDVILSDLEGTDHSSRPEILQFQRPFLMTGSCLMHRGALACSHLSSSDLREVALFCHAYRLLELTATEGVSQIVVWNEVFLSSVSSLGKESDPVYHMINQPIRMFLLVIGMDQTLLCMLMQLISHQSDNSRCPSLDPMYVSKGRSLLYELRMQDLFNPDLGQNTPLPSLLSADVALASHLARSNRQLSSSRSYHSSPITSNRVRKLSDPVFPRFNSARKLSFEAGSDSDDEDNAAGSIQKSSGHVRSHSMLHLKTSFRQRKQKHQLHANSSAELFTKSTTRRTSQPAYMLTPGFENLLFHFINLEPGCGLMLCPTHPPLSLGEIHAKLLLCFQHTCSSLRDQLRGGRDHGEEGSVVESDSESDADSEDWDSEEELGDREKSKQIPSPFVPRSSSVIEQGVLIECGTLSHKTPLCYWIIGRYFRKINRELYICCQENASQNMIEMAFKLLFGWSGQY